MNINKNNNLTTTQNADFINLRDEVVHIEYILYSFAI